VTIQPCLRTSDIEEVGDESHLTFFEMLGNFSFGGYFKKEAIEWAWEFLTDKKWLGIEPTRISATYFDHEKAKRGIAITIETDEESKAILEGLKGLKKIDGCGEDNFWSLGTIGSPGGPTVEFYVDGIEIWNLVFNEMIYKNVPSEHWQSASTKGVDTGMGLERLAAVMQGKKDIFETDLFLPMVEILENVGDKNYSDFTHEFRIVVDHIRAAIFLLAENITPSNKEHGYVVRRLIRSAVVKVYQMRIDDSIIVKIAEKVVDIYHKIYPDLGAKRHSIMGDLIEEVSNFKKTLGKGLKQFHYLIDKKNSLKGHDLFDLFQTYGFPLELSMQIAKERKKKLESRAIENFDREYHKHQKESRKASSGIFKGGLATFGEMEIKYHTATHLLHSALRKVLGNQIRQKGSNITAERLRFDFSYSEKMTSEQIEKVENLVNEKIKENLPVKMEEMSLEEAKKSGALGFFEHKYGDKVKVYSIGDFSREICGGPHVKSTGELDHFKIQSEKSSSSGVRRIKAIIK